MIPISDDNPQLHGAWVTYSIIFICVLTFFSAISLGPISVCVFGLVPDLLFDPGLSSNECSTASLGSLSMITHAFMHGGWVHIMGNMWMLHVFGNNVEDVMGHVRFLVFYLVLIVISGLAYAMTASASDIPLVGASGAISGVLAAYFWTYPKAKINTLIPLGLFLLTVRMPSWLMIGLWAVFQVVSLEMFNGHSSAVAYSAHVAGFAAGSLLVPLFKNQALVSQHPYAGWDAEIPAVQKDIPKFFKFLNYLFFFVVAIGLVIGFSSLF
jgi:membrane associated rhomboid family serine protease